MTFRVGQDVVYLGEVWTGIWLWIRKIFHPEPGTDLIVGQVYHIIGLTNEGDLLLAGVDNDGDDYWNDGFLKECFRAIVSRKTDISIFTKMLTGEKVRV